jgi:hypothetical protein
MTKDGLYLMISLLCGLPVVRFCPFFNPLIFPLICSSCMQESLGPCIKRMAPSLENPPSIPFHSPSLIVINHSLKPLLRPLQSIHTILMITLCHQRLKICIRDRVIEIGEFGDALLFQFGFYGGEFAFAYCFLDWG